jgi:hypothetical protein
MWGQIAAATIGYLGQKKANQANSAQAARSMDFQRETAQNAHQWEVEDLKKAGLNPLLSGTGGKGASASGGAQAKIENTANSALTSKLLNAQVNKLDAETAAVQGGVPAKTFGTDFMDWLGSAYQGSATKNLLDKWNDYTATQNNSAKQGYNKNQKLRVYINKSKEDLAK